MVKARELILYKGSLEYSIYTADIRAVFFLFANISLYLSTSTIYGRFRHFSSISIP